MTQERIVIRPSPIRGRIMCEDRYYIHPKLDPAKYKRIIYDPGLVTRIMLNRPRYLNALSHAHLAELEDALDRASWDENCHVIVLSGAGTCFCSGDDNIGRTPESAPTLWDGERSPAQLIEEYGSETAVWDLYNAEHDWWIAFPFHKKLRTIPKPTISMVHGWCIYQGFAVATNMDIVFASEDALFLGGPGLTDESRHKAFELAYAHRFLTAREAMELGIVSRVFPDFETLEKETMAFAYSVAMESPVQLRRAKESILLQLEILGYDTAGEVLRHPYHETWRRDAEEGHRMRYEGMGRARTPVALANLAHKLETEGKEVPEHIKARIDRAIERDDKATWQRSVHQDWRATDRADRATESLKAFEAMRQEDEKKWREEIERRGFRYEDLMPAYQKRVVQKKRKAEAKA